MDIIKELQKLIKHHTYLIVEDGTLNEWEVLELSDVKNIIDDYKEQKTKESEEEWISVEDRLPNMIGSYLVCYEEEAIRNLAWAFYTSSGLWATGNDFVKPTHWKPLPNLPKQ